MSMVSVQFGGCLGQQKNCIFQAVEKFDTGIEILRSFYVFFSKFDVAN
jgi:hypothetical protein